MMMTAPQANNPKKLTMETISKQMDTLPTVPDVIMRLSHMLDDPTVTAESLGSVIQLDPKLTAQILKACNSAYYGLNRRIANMKEAVAILGLKALKGLVFAILSSKMMSRDVMGYEQTKGALWLNALTGAIYAKRIAQHFKLSDPETAFTACILRDLGKLVLDSYVGADYALIEQEAQANKKGFEQAEIEVLGFSHAQLGEFIAQQWKFPELLITCIRHHHSPSLADDSLPQQDKQLLGAVHLADALSMMLGTGVGSDGLMYPVDVAFLTACGFKMDPRSMEQLVAVVSGLDTEVKQLAESIRS
jgi:HD-like signal output (HDOD) protein